MIEAQNERETHIRHVGGKINCSGNGICDAEKPRETQRNHRNLGLFQLMNLTRDEFHSTGCVKSTYEAETMHDNTLMQAE